MAKKVIQMYDKYLSTTKVYPKIIDDCIPEETLGKINDATKVTANPTLAGTESELTGIEVGDTKYKVPQPTTVIANPTLAGTEATLEGLQVGDTKYKVGGGKQLYLHNITIQTNSYVMLTCQIINQSDTAFTFDTLKTWLQTNNFINTNDCYMASGYYYYNSGSYLTIAGISYIAGDGGLSVIGKKEDNATFEHIGITTTSSFKDRIITL